MISTGDEARHGGVISVINDVRYGGRSEGERL